MMTEWIHRLYIVVPIVDQKKANELIAKLDPDPASQGGGFVRLSATGKEPATHLGTDTPATEAMLVEYKKLFDGWSGIGLTASPKFCRSEAKTGLSKESNVGAVLDNPSSFGDILSSQKLKVIEPEDLAIER